MSNRKLRHYALAVWIVYSLLAHVAAFAMWAGPSPTPPGTPDWFVWMVIFPHIVWGIVFLGGVVWSIAESVSIGVNKK